MESPQVSGATCIVCGRSAVSGVYVRGDFKTDVYYCADHLPEGIRIWATAKRCVALSLSDFEVQEFFPLNSDEWETARALAERVVDEAWRREGGAEDYLTASDILGKAFRDALFVALSLSFSESKDRFIWLSVSLALECSAVLLVGKQDEVRG